MRGFVVRDSRLLGCVWVRKNPPARGKSLVVVVGEGGFWWCARDFDSPT